MTALVKYEAARYALKIAQQVDEVKDIRDKAQAMAAYARQAKDMDMINWATEIKLRAERRVGELLNGAEKNTGAAGIGTSAVTRGDRTPPTLAEVGLTKRQSSDFQAIATIPEGEFEEEVKKPTTTTKSLVRASPKRKEKAKKEAKAPKPKKEKAAFDAAKCPNRDTCEVVLELAEVREKLDDAVDMLKTEDAVLGTDPAKEMQVLRQQLRQITQRRDELMTSNKERGKMVEYWKAQAVKLGWKPRDAKK